MNTLIAGGTGFIGTALARSLLADGHSVSILSRAPHPSRLPAGAQLFSWDGRTTRGWLDVFENSDAIVNLVGETTGRWPWTAGRKQRIHASRVWAGKAMVDAYQQAGRKPPVYIQASGITIYGPQGSQPVDESALPGDDFMARVAVDWEASTSTLDSMPAVRRAIIRTSLVLDARQGIQPLMALPVLLFVGGRLGTGRQGVSWIHIDDEVRAIRFLIENEKARGAFNLSAPHPLESAAYFRALAKALGRPYWLPVPAFALRLALGEMSTLVLDGEFAQPKRLLELGFVFKYERIEQAFQALYRSRPAL
ncbi:MAG TPA: TIGR01777 family oxidoreductase [Anaerolineales bacterium]|jgi:hypothetical protein